MRRWITLLRRAAQPSRLDRELREEREHHLSLRAADLEHQGLTPDEARRQARLEFGADAAMEEATRESSGLRWLDELRRNASYAVRQLRRNPAYSLSAVATLGLCIGANVAIFSAVDAVLLKPLPFPDQHKLALLTAEITRGDLLLAELESHNGSTWENVRDHAEAIDVAVMRGNSAGRNLAFENTARHIREHRVSAGYFRVLGVPPAYGREFTETEDRPAGAKVAVLSYELATLLFPHPQRALEETVRLKGDPYAVVGVMPPGFAGTSPAALWTPLRPERKGEGEGSNYRIIARPRDGMTLEQGEAAIASIVDAVVDPRRLNEQNGVRAQARLRLRPLQDALAAPQEGPLTLLWAAVLAVLAIGCVNIAGLVLARTGTRARELAIRRALGGGRSTVFRQLMTESLVLAFAGGAIGVAVAYAAKFALASLLREGFGIWQPIELDTRALAVAAGVSLTCGLLVGLYPAFRAGRNPVRPALTGSERGNAGSSRGFLRRGLVVVQTALCVMLIAAAGLLIRTFDHFRSLEPGFDPTGVVAADVSLDDARYTTAADTSRLFSRTLDTIRSTPGYVSAGAGLTLPYERALNLGFHVSGEPRGEGYTPTGLVWTLGDYFQTLRIPLLQGRHLRDADTVAAEKVVLVDRAFVEWYLGDRDPLDTHLSISGADRKIVGVVGAVQQRAGFTLRKGPIGAMPTVYIPLAQMDDRVVPLFHSWFTPSWIVRSEAPAGEVRRSLEAAVAVEDPLLPFSGFRTLREVQGEAWASHRVQALLVGSVATLALLLAAVGIYGLIASLVTARTREAGIRVALGASPRQAAWTVAGPGLTLATLGVVIGLAAAPAGARFIESSVWGVNVYDPATLIGAAATLLATAAVASLLPARRLLELEPAAVLRQE